METNNTRQITEQQIEYINNLPVSEKTDIIRKLLGGSRVELPVE